MTFNSEINLGSILTIVSLLITLWQFHRVDTKRIHSIEFKVGLMWKHFAHRFNLPENIDDLKD